MERNSIIEKAKEYKRRGYSPIPLLPREKFTNEKGWQKLNLDEDEINDRFSSNSNIGVLLGAPSNNLVDIDIDCEEGLLLHHLLPSTGSTFGRSSKRCSHYLYHSNTKTQNFQDPVAKKHGNEAMLVEIRSTGAQTVFPGSVHESGEEVTWDFDGDPEEVNETNLINAVSTFASACLIARYWPNGSRNEATLAVSGALLHSGWNESNTTQFVEAVIKASGDEESESRKKAIQSTINKYKSKANITGWPTLARLYDDQIISKVREWLDIYDFETESIANENAIDEPSDTLFDLDEARIDRYLDNEPPPSKVLFDGFPIPLNKSCVQIAAGGTGKSFLCLQMGVALASNTTLCDQWKVSIPGKVLILCAEDDTDEIHRRIYAITNYVREKIIASKDIYNIEGYSLSIEEFDMRLRENLFVKSLLGKDNLLTKDSAKGVTKTKTHGKLVRTANEIDDLRLIVVDPISRFRGGEENSAEDATRFVEALEDICQSTGATVLASHHANKDSQKSGGSGEQFASRGSSALTDGIRWQMNMATMSKYQAGKNNNKTIDRQSLVHITIPKSNYSKPFGEAWLKRLDKGVLEYTEITSKSDLQKESLLPKVVEIIKTRFEKGYEHTMTDFIDRYSGKDEQFGLGRDKFKKLVMEGIEEKILGLREPIKSKKRNVREVLYVIDDKKDDS